MLGASEIFTYGASKAYHVCKGFTTYPRPPLQTKLSSLRDKPMSLQIFTEDSPTPGRSVKTKSTKGNKKH